MGGYSPPIEAALVPVSANVLAMPGMGPVSAPWLPLVFGTFPDGTPYVYFGMRAAPRVGPGHPQSRVKQPARYRSTRSAKRLRSRPVSSEIRLTRYRRVLTCRCNSAAVCVQEPEFSRNTFTVCTRSEPCASS
uniref:Uncharacterized protein ORF14 n=1 Tax=Amycolatopsis lactamdurans TaxID=1913 RepID=Q51081_AMYLA|nr:unknown [Amycolatopsis lactamdurans]